jgi:fucose permease
MASNRSVVWGFIGGIVAATVAVVAVRALGYEFLTVGAGILAACVGSAAVAYVVGRRK